MLKVKRRFYYGWWIVVTCLIGLLVQSGTGTYSFNVIFPYLTAEFQWSRAASAAAISTYFLAMGIAGPFLGKLTDRYGPKWIMAIGTLFTGGSLVMLSFTNSLPYLYFFYAVLAIAHSAGVLITYGCLISRWFIRQRGKAIGLASTGVSLGGFLIVPLTERLVYLYDWRISYVILGALVICVFMPLVLFVVKASPGEAGLLPDGLPVNEASNLPLTPTMDSSPGLPPPDSEWTLRSISRTWSFWLMSICLFCYYAALFGVLIHQINFILDMGISSTAAAFALSFTALSGVIGKPFIGYIADRFSVKAAAITGLGIQLAGILILIATDNPAMLWLYVIVFGFSMGGVTIRPLLPTWLFGLASLGTLQGIAQVSMSAGSAIGPFLSGYIFDVSGSYHTAFAIFAALSGIGILAISFAHPPKGPIV